MTWTTPAELRSQVQKWYDRGILLAALAENGEEFPRRLNLRGPTSRDLGEVLARFATGLRTSRREPSFTASSGAASGIGFSAPIRCPRKSGSIPWKTPWP